MTVSVEAHGLASIETGSQSFALASKVLPRNLREDASMLYAWCRFCDDVIDGQIMGHGQLTDYRVGQQDRLDELRTRTEQALHGSPDNDPVFVGLSKVVSTHNIPHKHPLALLKGFEMDVQERSYESVDDILDYSYHVAGVVGVMMAQIMGVDDELTLDRASDLGLAFQLTNIARDIFEDAIAGRIFVPSTLLKKNAAPVTANEIARRENWPKVYGAALELLDIAEAYYASARIGVRALPFRCAWAIMAALSVYREIGETLRKQGPQAWAGRVGAGRGRKVWLASQSLWPVIFPGKADIISREGFYTRP